MVKKSPNPVDVRYGSALSSHTHPTCDHNESLQVTPACSIPTVRMVDPRVKCPFPYPPSLPHTNDPKTVAGTR